MINSRPDDPAAAAIRRLVSGVQADVEFGPLVSDEFRHGYQAARSDLAAMLDVAVTQIVIADRARRKPRAGRAES